MYYIHHNKLRNTKLYDIFDKQAQKTVDTILISNHGKIFINYNEKEVHNLMLEHLKFCKNIMELVKTIAESDYILKYQEQK